MGPNCLGLIRPEIGLNITFGNNMAKPGPLALVSQSGAICTAILDWAESNEIGFSAVVSTGIGADLDFGDYLDYLAADPKTHAILLYIEGIADARRFMSSVRAAARAKPVIALKVGLAERLVLRPIRRVPLGQLLGREISRRCQLQIVGV